MGEASKQDSTCSVVSRAIGEAVAVAVAMTVPLGVVSMLLRRTVDAWQAHWAWRLVCLSVLLGSAHGPLMMRLVGAEDFVVSGQNQSCGN